MPNHVTNKIHIDANEEKTGEILDVVKFEKECLGAIDFNKIIPTPENIYQGNLGAEEVAQYGENIWLNFNTKSVKAIFITYTLYFTFSQFDVIDLIHVYIINMNERKLLMLGLHLCH